MFTKTFDEAIQPNLMVLSAANGYSLEVFERVQAFAKIVIQLMYLNYISGKGAADYAVRWNFWKTAESPG